MTTEKPVIVTNEAEIESIKRNNGIDDIIGAYNEQGGYWFADPVSLADWRERQRLSTTDNGENT